jgi:hypothetical protein
MKEEEAPEGGEDDATVDAESTEEAEASETEETTED